MYKNILNNIFFIREVIHIHPLHIPMQQSFKSTIIYNSNDMHKICIYIVSLFIIMHNSVKLLHILIIHKKKKKKNLKFFMGPTNQIFNLIFFFEKWIGYDMSSFPFPLKKSRLYKLGTTVNFGCFFL
jgi:hypothetical protein